MSKLKNCVRFLFCSSHNLRVFIDAVRKIESKKKTTKTIFFDHQSYLLCAHRTVTDELIEKCSFLHCYKLQFVDVRLMFLLTNSFRITNV